MAIDTAKPITLGPWPVGVNNRQKAHAMPVDKDGRAVAITDCVNADMDNTGKPRRRDGFDKVASALAAHDAFSCEAGVFFMDGMRLQRLNDDDSVTDLGGSLRGEHVAYEYANGTLYLSDGEVCKRIVNGALLDWGIEVPASPIMSQSATAGGFTAGRYLAAVTYLRNDGQESGASQPIAFDLTDGAGVNFAILPMSSSPEVAYLRLYLSRPNGSVLYHAATVANGTANIQLLADDGGAGKQLSMLSLSPPPAGRIVREYGGRMLIADGKTLWISESYAYELFNLSIGYIQFAGDITVVEPVDGGIWIAADKTWFLRGTGPADFFPVERLDYGAIFGTACDVPGTPNKMWHTPRGTVIAGPGGEIKNLTEANVAMGPAASGAAMVREFDGLRAFVTSLRDFSISSLAAAQPATPTPTSSTLSSGAMADFFTATVIP